MDAEDVKEIADNVGKITGEIKKKYGTNGLIIFGCLWIIAIMGIVLLWNMMIRTAVGTAVDSFFESSETAKNQSHEEYYNKAYAKAEDQFKSTHNVSLNIGAIRKTAKLETLSIYEETYVIETEEQKKKGIYLWTKFGGYGTYTVDLKEAEIIVDDANQYISIRIPEPELTEFSLDEDESMVLMYKDRSKEVKIPFLPPQKFFGGSYSEGFALYDGQKKEASKTIRENIASNQDYYNSAKESAIVQIEKLIRSLNPKVPDLKIDVEFY